MSFTTCPTCSLCGNDDVGLFHVLSKSDAREYKAGYECKKCGGLSK